MLKPKRRDKTRSQKAKNTHTQSMNKVTVSLLFRDHQLEKTPKAFNSEFQMR
jgi:hypothetical protein